MNTPLATVRLQLRTGFDFDAARATLDYHAAMGISHVYLSPVLEARTGSTHGYDTLDYDCVEPALGGEAGLRRLAAAAHARDMGVIVDFVPNHMGVSADNAWWQDVQRWGRDSRYAHYFDIQWHTPDGATQPLLLPVLTCDYGQALTTGAFELAWLNGEAYLHYADQHYPLTPASLPALLRQAFADDVADHVEQALNEHTPGTDAARDAVREAVANAATQEAVDATWRRWSADDPAALDRLLQAQPWRVLDWRAAGDVLNWRRFFNINGLAALCVERDDVYQAVHRCILRLHDECVIDGLRIDHIDGLAAPAAYCQRLRADLQRTAHGRPTYLIVEKILGDGEALPSSWPVDGTTGYDFMTQVGAVLHDADGADPLSALYQRLCGDRLDFSAHELRARCEVLHSLFVCDLDMTCQHFHHLAVHSKTHRDLAFPSLRRALSALVVAYAVYRSYAADGCIQAVEEALPRARVSLAARDHAALEFVATCLRRAHAVPALRAASARFEQLTAPVAAKAVEDTAFYRYPRLLSRNEVGSDPGGIGGSVDAFHEACIHRQQHWPSAMLATASHDHKLGEDARMRLATLSQCPRRWAHRSRRWLQRWPSDSTRQDPDARDVYMMLQMLVGTWPPHMRVDDTHAKQAWMKRLRAWLTKALRESRRHGTWTHPDSAYENAAAELLEAMFDHTDFLADIERFVLTIGPAGALSSLAQLTLRCTTPGVPDLYQGRELWDFSMVDPDNRHPIDFAAHQALLDPAATIAALLPTWQDGRIKQAWLARLLRWRRDQPQLLLQGTYLPLEVTGSQRQHVIAFMRSHQQDVAVVVVPRCPLRLLGRRSMPLIRGERWGDTAVHLPSALAHRHLIGLGSANPLLHDVGRLPVAQILDQVPVDVLV